MRSPYITLVLLISMAGAFAKNTADVSTLRRLYDFTPVSATNPVIARVKKCGIEIPVSEFQVYARTTLSSDAGAVAGPLTPADKRRLLEGLIDDHFLLWDGYQKKADQTPQLTNLLNSTETMLLQETLVQQEVNDKAKTFEEARQRSQKLRDELFDKTRITVSNEAYDDLKGAIRRLDLAAVESVDLEKLGPGAGRPLARWKGGVVTEGDILTAWAAAAAGKRPDLEKPEVLTALLKTLLEDAMLAQEGRDRGLEKAPIVLQKMQENRNLLTRMYAIDRLTDEAVAEMKKPETRDRIREWYETNRATRFTYRDEAGRSQVIDFDKNRDSIENDYFDMLNEKVRAEYVHGLRQGHPVEIDEPLLDKVVVAPIVAGPTELSRSVVAWDAETKDHVVQAGETNALFTFQFTNVSTNDVTLFEVKPSCECTTVRLPALPWKVAPGEKGTFDANVDLQNKTNNFTRKIQVESSQGGKALTLNIVMPAAPKTSVPQ